MAKANDNELVFPENLTEMSSEDLSSLHDTAVEAFETLFGNGEDLSNETLASLESITEGIESVRGEMAVRKGDADKRSEAAAALAAKVKPLAVAVDEVVEEEVVEEEVVEETAEALATEARRELRVTIPRPKAQVRQVEEAPKTVKSIMFAGKDSGLSTGLGVDFDDVARSIDRSFVNFNESAYEMAQSEGRHLREQFSMAVIKKPFDLELVIKSDDLTHIQEVMKHATDEKRLPGGSLVASGGWCAPSEVIYDICELESHDGIFSLPEVNVKRGGLRFTQGPQFATLFQQGFTFTEANDLAGQYGVNPAINAATGFPNYGNASAGNKPCYNVACPPFIEQRLDFDGVCVTAGLLQMRGYPEVVARTIRGVMVGHDSRLAANIINKIVQGSTAITYAGHTDGAIAPILSAVEQQVEHYRYTNRLARAASLEAVFPYWIRGVIRADLSRRLGLAEFDVPDSRIDGWFRDRGVNPQYVYNWQDLQTTAASGFVQWPANVSFLLYKAGTWIKGASDIISLDNIYDSATLGQNNFTALFTEEGYLVAKMCSDSRVVTVPLCANGAANIGNAIACPI